MSSNVAESYERVNGLTLVSGTRYDEIRGVLPDGFATDYMIRVPDTWNGTLLNDLDYIDAADTPQRTFLLERGYALSGTTRFATFNLHRDLHRDVANQVRVLDIVHDAFEAPRRTIQIGCSGGGAVALAMGEMQGDRVDGVIALGSQTFVVIANMWLDLAFSLKGLLAPDSDLPVADVPIGDAQPAIAAWLDALAAAQQSLAGRARIALGVALAQWPTWASFRPCHAPRPDPADLPATQEAMYQSAREGITAAIGVRHAPQSNPGGLISWNIGVDYTEFYANADPIQQDVVRNLYRVAGLDPDDDIRADLRRIDAQPRIEADPRAFAYWKARAHTGKPDVPVLHGHTIGDAGAPPAFIQGYGAKVHAEDREHLYRQVLVERANHCGYSVSETAAMVETMMGRLDTGIWSTDPEDLNTLAKTFHTDDARFIRHQLPHLNRAFYRDSVYPAP